jgi:anti-sigma B factor antagonist
MDIRYDRPALLRLTRLDRRPGVGCIAVTGDVDMSTGDEFRRTVTRELHRPGLRTLLLDVGSLRFIDSNGVAVLIMTHRMAGDRGLSFAVVNAGPRIRTVLELMGVYEMLTTDRP